jgi:hypothetical protein
MDRVAVEYPDRYLGIAAHLIPKEIEATISASVGLSPEHMAVLEAIRAEVPDANNQSPQAVLEYVMEAVRARGAKTIEFHAPPDHHTDGTTAINSKLVNEINTR